MIKTAITGNIASGKSEAEKILSEHNFPVIDTDKITHFLLENSAEVKEKIRKNFSGHDIYDENGMISRKKLGKIVFSDQKLLKILENIIHPEVIKEINKFFEQNKNEKYAFVSVPLLYEANLACLFDRVILIYTNDEIREKRLTENRHYTKEEAQIRMSAQISQDKKTELADFVIYNNSDLENFAEQLRKFIVL